MNGRHGSSRVFSLGLSIAAIVAAAGWIAFRQLPDPAVDSPAAPMDRRAALLSLGYLEFTSSDAADGGVIKHNSARSWPGYSLYTSRNLCSATLTDPAGRIVRSWTGAARHWARAELCDDGNVLVVGTASDRRTEDEPVHDLGTVWRFSWEGDLLAAHRISAHHDVERTPAGRILTVTSQLRSVPDIHPSCPVIEDRLTLLDDEGNELDAVSLVDVLRQPIEGFALTSIAPWKIDGQLRVDLTHTNSVEWMARRPLFGTHPVYGEDHVLICMRHQDAVAVVDFKQHRLVWAWGQDELQGPHDATLLENGNILVLDNGVTRGTSRAVEVDPRTGSIVWQYPCGDAQPFFTLSMGSAHRLPNGNTLIADSNHSRAFEVTRGGQTVWEYLNPNKNDDGRRSVITSMKRYPSDRIESIERRHAE